MMNRNGYFLPGGRIEIKDASGKVPGKGGLEAHLPVFIETVDVVELIGIVVCAAIEGEDKGVGVLQGEGRWIIPDILQRAELESAIPEKTSRQRECAMAGSSPLQTVLLVP